jgi:hypothetical protein
MRDTHGQLAVLGVEVWLATKPGPMIPTRPFYSVSIESSPNEDSGKMVSRSCLAARRFIQTFKWDPLDDASNYQEPYFNLTVDAE